MGKKINAEVMHKVWKTYLSECTRVKELVESQTYVVSGIEISKDEFIELLVKSQCCSLVSEDAKYIYAAIHNGSNFDCKKLDYASEEATDFKVLRQEHNGVHDAFYGNSTLKETGVFEKLNIEPYATRNLNTAGAFVEEETKEMIDFLTVLFNTYPNMGKEVIDNIYDRIPPSMRDDSKTQEENITEYLNMVK